MPIPALRVSGFVKSYRDRRVVDEVSFAAASGQVTALLGPNGAGKTTTVECCVGLRLPTAGAIQVLGVDPARASADQRARVGVMLQESGMPTGQRAGAMLAHIASLYADPLPLEPLRARLGIDAFARTPVRKLSGGQRQRLAVAVAIVGQPQVVFLDEPSAGLDPAARVVMWEIIGELRAREVAVILTTHDIDEAQALADLVLIMDNGRIIARGSPSELTGTGTVLTTERPLSAAECASLAATLNVAMLTLCAPSQAGTASYTVPLPTTPATVAAIATWGATHQVLITSGRRCLREVFLDLTGRELA